MFSKLQGLIGIAAGLSLVGCSADSGSVSPEIASKPVQTEMAKLENGYGQASNYVGRVEAVFDSQVGFEVPGTLTQANVEEGDAVSAGDVLAQLDTSRLLAQRSEARASLQRTRADLKLARSTLTRTEEAFSYKGVSQQELDEANQRVDALSAGVSAAQAQLNRIQVDLDKAQLRAPFAGKIVRRFADPGEFLNVGAPLYSLQSDVPPEVRVGVAPAAAASLELQKTYELEINQQTVSATLKTVIPKRDSATRTLDAVFVLDGGHAFVRPGDLANLRLESWIDKDGFWIPLTALSEAPRGLWRVLVAEPEHDSGTHTLVNRTIEVLHFDGDSAFVDGTLKEGELLVSEGLHRVVVGQKVNPIANRQLALGN